MTLTAVSPTSLLSRDEEVALARRVEAGVIAEAVLARRFTWASRDAVASDADLAAVRADGQAAREVLVGRNIGLVWFVVNPVANRTGLEADELFQEGVVGVLEAVERFDPDKGGFATFALTRIRLRVAEAAATALGSLGLPAGRARLWRQVRMVETALTGVLARDPLPAEVAEACGRPVALVRDLLEYLPAKRLGDDDEFPVQVAPVPGVDPLSVRRLLRPLDVGDRAILVQRFGLDGSACRSYVEVAARLGLSETTVRRRERAALDRLRGLGVPDLAA